MNNATTAIEAETTPGTANAENPQSSAVDGALDALEHYDAGSNRGALVPLDDAVVASLEDAEARGSLERRLLRALRARMSPVATEYVCSKLALIGSADSASVLAEMLSDPERSHSARRALEAMPFPAALEALRQKLPELTGIQKAGAIDSLGARRDDRAVPALIALLEDPDLAITGAAAAALGNIGTVTAGAALRAVLAKAPEPNRLVVADACLAAAEHLSEEGHPSEAREIYRALTDSKLPEHIRAAARRRLEESSEGQTAPG